MTTGAFGVVIVVLERCCTDRALVYSTRHSLNEMLRAADSSSVGWGSLQKRATDVQLALDVLSRGSKPKLDDGRAFRADLRDTNLQGAALGKAQLHAYGAEQADFQGSDFRGASLFGASFESAKEQRVFQAGR
jgi:uncharacterized protein YjbI with pentapeptide repeats